MTVAQLREEMGRPTLDPSDPGYVPNETLQGIIDRIQKETIAAALVALDTAVAAGNIPGPTYLYERVEVTLTADGLQPPLVSGLLPEGSYPFVIGVTDEDGREYQSDPHLRRTANVAFWPVYAYSLVGGEIVEPTVDTGDEPDTPEEAFAPRIYAINRTGTPQATGQGAQVAPMTLSLHVAQVTDLVTQVLDGGGGSNSANKQIVAAATDLLARLIAEGTRQEMTGNPAGTL